MPDNSQPIRQGAGSDSTERLNSAIDRMLGGGPVPVLTDPELNDLLNLATRLRDELPNDLPDPMFRIGLKDQLTATRPVTVPRTRTASPTRFPWVAAVSAIAAVLIAAVSVGTMGIWLNDDDDSQTGFTNGTNITANQMTATVAGIATMTAQTDSNLSDSTPEATVPTQPSSMTALQPSAEATDAAGETPSTEIGTEPTSTETVPATRTIELTSTSESTAGPSLARVPPVDRQHIEHGPQPAADGGGGAAPTNVAYMLETPLPELGSETWIYRFVPPSVDPETFVTSIANEIGLQGEIVTDAPQGRTVHHLFDDTRGSFHWTPETGAFAVSLAESGIGEAIPLDQIINAASVWLTDIGYPVEQLDTAIQAEPASDTSWRLDVRYAAMPEIGLGHPLGVTIYVNADGAVTEAFGYWLTMTDTEPASLHRSDEIWEAISSGYGYWTGGGIVEDGGEFRADSMLVTYILTRDTSGELVLQPVVQTSGEFTSADGLSSARISCFVQAARTSAP